MTTQTYDRGTGRRKCAVAQVRIFPGSGVIIVNGKPYQEVFTRLEHRRTIEMPFSATGTVGKYNAEVKVRKWYRKLDFFDIFGLGGMIIMLVLQQTEGWAIADSSYVITDNIMSTIYMVIILIFIFLYLCLPIDVVEFKTPSITYRIRVTKKLGDQNLIGKYISNLASFPKEVLKSV